MRRRWFGVVPLAAAVAPAVAQTAPVSYADLAPLFTVRCVMCHGGTAPIAGLSLDSYDGLLDGSARGPVVVAGDAGASELVRRIKGESLPRMPMTGPPFLSDEEIAAIERWVADGMPEGAATASTADAEPGAEEPVDYRRVAPIFAARCVKCHTDGGLMGDAPEGFRLTSYDEALASGDRARVVPGSPSASELLRRVRGQSLPRMPFDGPPFLSEEEIALVEEWIARGAPDSEGRAAPVPAGAKVRLHGTLASGAMLDDLPLVMTASTRIDKSPGAGDYVQVRGRVTPEGRIRVERLRPR